MTRQNHFSERLKPKKVSCTRFCQETRVYYEIQFKDAANFPV